MHCACATGTYLTFRQQSGLGQPIDQHTDVELMLESYATEHEDLSDNIEELQDAVSTHRLLEQVTNPALGSNPV